MHVINIELSSSFLVERRKETHGDSLDKQHKKKIERDEEKLKNNNRDLSLVKMKSMFATGFAFTALLSMFNSMYVLVEKRYLELFIMSFFAVLTEGLSLVCLSCPSRGFKD